jgi:oligopeptide transport system substrate-binding protein
MSRLKYLLFVLPLAIAACTGGDGSSSKKRVAKGDKAVYGGTFQVAESESHQTLFPQHVVDVTTWHIVSQVYEGLVKFDVKSLEVIPALAEKWSLDDSQTEYTFTLRDNVKFHDDACFSGGKGRVVTAEDFKFAFELLCSNTPDNIYYKSTFKNVVEGADDFFDGKSNAVSGIKVVDSKTLKIKLIQPSASFTQILAGPYCAVFPKEAYDKYGSDLTTGTGPFRITESSDKNDRFILVYNPNYYLSDENGNAYPYLDSIVFNFIPTKLAELEEFRKENISLIYGLPSSKVTEVVKEDLTNFSSKPPKKVLLREQEMVSQFYEFNLTKPPFNNALVRKAFCHTVNRQKILDDVLNGQGTPGNYGITPKIRSFKSYNFDTIPSYEYNPELARKLLAEAGYADGKGFPQVHLEINSGGATYSRVASEIQQQLFNNLNVNVEIVTVSLKEKIESASYGRSEFYRSSWTADYPSPATFLRLFYGGDVPETMDKPSYPNISRYKNPVFDSLYVKAEMTLDENERLRLLSLAERQMMLDAPLMVLWYGENYKMYYSNVRGFHDNPMSYYDFTKIYLKDLSMEEYEAIQKGSQQASN